MVVPTGWLWGDVPGVVMVRRQEAGGRRPGAGGRGSGAEGRGREAEGLIQNLKSEI